MKKDNQVPVWEKGLREANKVFPMAIDNWSMEDWIKYISNLLKEQKRQGKQECIIDIEEALTYDEWQELTSKI